MACQGAGGGKPSFGTRDWRFRLQFKKTQLCSSYFQKAACTKGDRCRFAHSEEEIKLAPDLTKTSLCKAFRKKVCPLSAADCPFAHGARDLRSTDAYRLKPQRKMAVGGEAVGSGQKLESSYVAHSTPASPACWALPVGFASWQPSVQTCIEVAGQVGGASLVPQPLGMLATAPQCHGTWCAPHWAPALGASACAQLVVSVAQQPGCFDATSTAAVLEQAFQQAMPSHDED